jgi:putative salt-induced outer membrane protein YdiY
MTYGDSRRRSGLILAGLAVAVVAARPATAQESITWENSTELSFVSTGGNASASTVGLKATLSGTKGANKIKLEVGGLRSSIDNTTRTATGTPSDFTVIETTVSQVTAENYFARGRYDRKLDDAFLFAGLDWDRNTFAGIKNRYAVVAGIGRTLVDGETGHLKADIGGTYTIQKDVDPTPGASDGFGGARINVDALRHLSASADYASALILDENLADTQDLRADWTNSITVALSQKLALKTSVQLLFDNLPSLRKVPLVDGGGAPTGTTVSTPGDKLDRVATLTLVIKL